MAGGAIFQLQDIHPSHYGHLFPNDRFDKKKKKKINSRLVGSLRLIIAGLLYKAHFMKSR
jgi:hypothetical protein